MKKIALWGLFIFFACSTLAYAHPPVDIKMTFDPDSRMLTAEIIHYTNDIANHFIKKVDVALNGKEIIQHRLSRQDNFGNQVVSYLIPDIKPGDVLSVKAYCSMGGTLKKQLDKTL